MSMKYKVIEPFTDLQDNNYAYAVGDVYPHKGYTPDEDRINELASADNLRNRPVIAADVTTPKKEKVTEEKVEAAENENGKEESTEGEKPKRKKRDE